MRIDRLSLIRYAAYTDRTLTFDPSAALHVVYGPNEAGKSSALAAISDLLFGFARTKDAKADFLHEAKHLRLGATLRSRAGEAISFRRRRGNKQTLLADADDETALNDDALAPWLGGLTREIFTASFGLNSDTLRAGAEDMLQPGGDLNTTVMAAASGLTGLNELRGRLDAEADELYARRASTRAFNEAQTRFNAAKEAERAHELKSTAWRELNQAMDQAEQTLAERRKRREAVLTEEKRIDTLRALRSVVAEIDAGARDLAAYDDLAAVPEGLGTSLRAHLEAVEAAGRDLDTASAQVEAARRHLAGITVDEAMVAEAAEVQAVFRDSGAYAQHLDDLPAVAAERDAEAARIADRARRLGLAPDALTARQPTDATLARAGEAAAALRSVEAQREEAARALAKAEDALARIERDGGGGHLTDPQPARADLAALQPRLDALRQRDKLAAQLRTLRRDMDEALEGLSPRPNLAAPALAGLPPVARLAEQAEAIKGIERDGLEDRKRLREVEARRETVERRIAEAEAEGPVPSAEAVQAARRARDTALTAVGDAATGKAPLGADAAADAVATAGRLTAEADALADQALNEAARVTRYVALKAEAADLGIDISRREADLTDLRAMLTSEKDAWRAPFTAAGIEPGRPDDMVEWRRRLDALLEDRAAAETVEDELTALAEQEEALAAALAVIAKRSGLTLPALPTDALAARLSEAVADLERAWQRGRETARLRTHHEDEVKRLASERTALDARHADAAARLATAAADLGLSGEATPDELETTLALWREVPGLVEAHGRAERRHATLAEARDRFETTVTRLVDRLAPDLSALPPAAACAELAERAGTARAEKKRQEDAAKALVTAEEAAAERQAGRARAAEAADRAFADLPEGERTTLVDRLVARDTIAAELSQCRRRFAEIAPGEDEAAVRQQLDRLDPAEADARREELAREAARLGEEENEAYSTLRDHQRERERMSVAEGAETAAFEKNAAAAEMEGIARRWAVLRIASQLLSGAVERQRQRHHAPLIERAGALFATLTNGAYDGLAQRFDEADRMQLYARRGEDVLDRGALSDGTRDQLFLALRLAIVEDYAGRNEPAPFVGDDIFQTFDDERTGAGLAALADFGANVQPILFAHHRSVVDIARDRLGDRVDVITLA